jgi:hypothetical protein
MPSTNWRLNLSSVPRTTGRDTLLDDVAFLDVVDDGVDDTVLVTRGAQHGAERRARRQAQRAVLLRRPEVLEREHAVFLPLPPAAAAAEVRVRRR